MIKRNKTKLDKDEKNSKMSIKSPIKIDIRIDYERRNRKL